MKFLSRRERGKLFPQTLVSVPALSGLQDVLVPVRFFFRIYAQIQRKIALLLYFDHNLI
jgi:hypothetical protein